jgi:hypothetical protein
VPSFISRILSFALRLVLWTFAAIFAISLLAASLILIAVSLLWSLVTGKKSKPAMVFGQFQRFTAQTAWPPRNGKNGTAAPRESDVVDVEVREVRDDKPQP